MDVFEAIFGRRSIRRFLDKDVSDELILKVLEAARWAPSSKNRQPWEFIVVRDKRIKEAISKLAPYGSFIKDAPVVIAVVTNPNLSPNFHLVDGSCAVQNLMLAAHSLGLGTCWIGTADRERIKEILGIPTKLHLLTVVPIGYPAETPAGKPRKPLEEIVHMEKYGRSLRGEAKRWG